MRAWRSGLAPGIELEEQLVGELHGGVMAPGQ